MGTRLADWFCAAAPGTAPGDLDLQRQLGALVAKAQEAWPGLEVPEETFIRFVAERVRNTPDRSARLAGVHAPDLYLVCACLAGSESALAELERGYFSRLPATLSRVTHSQDDTDEVMQGLREKLLVCTGDAPPRLTQYSGLGPLGAWLRVSALRTAMSLRRRERLHVPLEEQLLEMSSAFPATEAAVMRRLGKRDLAQALRTAIEAQSSRTRAVLRLYYADGHGVEDIGRLYRVHASTVSRWLAAARADILAAVHRVLRTELGLERDEAESLLGIASSLEVSLASLLATAE